MCTSIMKSASIFWGICICLVYLLQYVRLDERLLSKTERRKTEGMLFLSQHEMSTKDLAGLGVGKAKLLH